MFMKILKSQVTIISQVTTFLFFPLPKEMEGTYVAHLQPLLFVLVLILSSNILEIP